MKGAALLAKHDQFFTEFSEFLKGLGYRYAHDEKSIVLLTDNKMNYFAFSDRPKEPSILERCEIPSQALEAGYRFGYLVDCRSESLFCDIVRAVPPTIDVLVFDNNLDDNAALQKPSELNPDTLSL